MLRTYRRAAGGERKAQVNAKSVGYCSLKCICSKKLEREMPKDTQEASKDRPRHGQEAPKSAQQAPKRGPNELA